MRRRAFLATGLAPLAAGAETSRPNIVFILADDLGWAELGCYGNRFCSTPHLDRLAADGLRFTHAYSAAPVCSPMRASFMTGQTPARVGILDYLRADDTNHLSPKLPTLAKLLKDGGYRTGLIGKWHLMGDYRTRPGDPKLHGFDEVICSEQSYIGPGYYWHPYKHLPDVAARLPSEYLTDRLNLEAVDFIGRNAGGGKPFFLYLAHYAPHTRLSGKPELEKKYAARADAGKNRNNPQLAAMLESIDEGVGMIVAALDKHGIAGNTVVVFCSDNGGELNVTTNGGLRGGKSMLYEGGIRVPLLVRWKGRIAAGGVSSEPVSSIDYYPTLLELAGVQAPRGHVVDGVSLNRLFQKPKGKLKGRDLAWYYPLEKDHFLGGKSAMAMRDRRWKLIHFLNSGERQLFDLQADPGEQNNLAEREPQVVASMSARLAAWRERTVKQ
ncbi:MAG: sulfatase [Bryobacterales bacterium]|nr:sulfatase [Bryobacterales bacterium]